MLQKETFLKRVDNYEANATSSNISSNGIEPPDFKFEASSESSGHSKSLPTQLKKESESKSDMSLTDVNVYYNSNKPKEIGAEAFTSGNDIHLAKGQENHLAHEVEHVIQQKQGRVKPTGNFGGNPVNESSVLEKEADKGSSGMIKSSNILNSNPSGAFVGQPSVLQAKKTGVFTGARKLASKVADYAEYKGKEGATFDDWMYNKCKGIYDRCLEKGTGYWEDLQAARSSYEEGDEEFLSGLKEKQGHYDEKFKSNYKTKTKKRTNAIKKDENNKELTSMTSGIGVEGQTNKHVGTDKPYANHFDFNDNSIDAAHNYGNRDDARLADVENKDNEGYEKRGLPNSEIIWQQYKEASQKQFWVNKAKKAAELRKGLSSLNRKQVKPKTTWGTVIFALPDGQVDLQTARSWGNGSEEFKALLGTPNCSGAAFMLKDHVNDLEGKNISNIDLQSSSNDLNLDIKLT